MTWEALENLIKANLLRYRDLYNSVNKEYEMEFDLTINPLQVEVQGVKKWTAYLRLAKRMRPKGGSEEEWESLLIYNQAYRFETVQERLDPKAPWKFALYEDLLGRLIAGGIEYGELLHRMKYIQQMAKDAPVAEATGAKNPLDIIVTDQMPPPLSPAEQHYANWIKDNHQKE